MDEKAALMQCRDFDEAHRCNNHPTIKPVSFKIIAQTQPEFEGVPTFSMPDESEEETLIYANTHSFGESEKWIDHSHFMLRKAVKFGYNKAKEKYQFTEEDMRRCWKQAIVIGAEKYY